MVLNEDHRSILIKKLYCQKVMVQENWWSNFRLKPGRIKSRWIS